MDSNYLIFIDARPFNPIRIFVIDLSVNSVIKEYSNYVYSNITKEVKNLFKKYNTKSMVINDECEIFEDNLKKKL